MSDIDSANVGFLLLDQCETDRTTLTKGIADATEAIKQQQKVIQSAKNDSALQAQTIAEYILYVNNTEKLQKKEARKKTVKSVVHYTIHVALFGALLYSVFSK